MSESEREAAEFAAQPGVISPTNGIVWRRLIGQILTLSQELPALRARGESQSLEYIECFPVQARELAKEIAAFATTNQGLILLGVANNGDLVGLGDAFTQEGRDLLLRRVEGILPRHHQTRHNSDGKVGRRRPAR